MRIASKTRRAALVAAAVLLPLAAAAPVRAQTAPNDGERAWVQRLQSAFTRGELENAALETGAADAVDPIVALAATTGPTDQGSDRRQGLTGSIISAAS